MPKLFNRRAIVTVGTGQGQGIKIDTLQSDGSLDLSFSVQRTLKKEPNKCEIRIFNLRPTTRARISELKRIPVILQAGYETGTTLIFKGDLREARTERNGADIVTIISGEDGGRAHRTARISEAMGRNAKFEDAVRLVASKMGVGTGNLESIISEMQLEGVSSKFAGGVSFHGSATRVFDRLCKSAGIEYSIQDGNIQLLRRRQSMPGIATLVSSDTGMIGSPTRSNEGLVKVETMMIPDMFPGRRIEIRSDDVKGFYRIEKASYSGETTGGSWAISSECREV